MPAEAPTRRAVVLSGGPHPFHETTPRLVALLESEGLACHVVDHPDDAAPLVAPPHRPDLFVLNTLRWRMLAPRYTDRRAHAYTTSDTVRAAFPAYVHGGGALLALHGAPICFDDWPGWRDLVGAAWVWDVSSHPPLGDMQVRVQGNHPVVEGIEDFTVFDEAYGFMDLVDDVEPLATAHHGGVDHPLLWVRGFGAGRVVTCTLGHGAESFDHPTHRALLRRSVRWLLDGGSGEPTG
jgi:uncharacterized protein